MRRKGEEMALVDRIIAQAQTNPRTIVLPEPEDERVLRAALAIEDSCGQPRHGRCHEKGTRDYPRFPGN